MDAVTEQPFSFVVLWAVEKSKATSAVFLACSSVYYSISDVLGRINQYRLLYRAHSYV